MSDVSLHDKDLARGLIAEAARHCWRGKGDMIDRVHDALHNAKFTHWTRRRVRALWHREAAGVRYHEMTELAAVAEIEKRRQHRIEDARNDHAEFIARTARIAEALAVQDEEFHREAIAAYRGISIQRDDLSIGGYSRPSDASASQSATLRGMARTGGTAE